MYLYKPNKKWPTLFEAQKNELINHASVAIELHHIGSTSVAGLYAKNVLDILGLVESFEASRSLINDFVALGYEYRGEYGIARRHYFVRRTPYVSHLHIHEYGDINALNHLHFKELLSVKPELRQELNDLKIRLHNKFPENKAEYQKEKQPFYDRVHSMRTNPSS